MTTAFKSIVGMGALALTLGLAGCGGDKTAEATPTKSDAKPETSTPAGDLPVIKVVTDGESPPMSFMDERGNPVGIDIDVIRSIGESQGFKVEVHRDIFSNIFSGIENGKYHVAISSLSLTPERASKYGYTDSYLYNPPIIMHNQPANINELHEIKPLRVATTDGTMFTPIAENLKPTKHYINNTNFQNYQGLLQDHVDAIMGDKYVLEYMLARHPHKELNSFEYKIGDGSSANMVIYTRKSNQDLIDKLNKGISELKQSGQIDKIVQHYLKAH